MRDIALPIITIFVAVLVLFWGNRWQSPPRREWFVVGGILVAIGVAINITIAFALWIVAFAIAAITIVGVAVYSGRKRRGDSALST